ncbi:MAG TPA: DUF262 domain-containing protein [Flavipsychrobacter sp.]|nr:DUF262 domain-containing protein [Flavipsychrobacter sp.]
MAPRIYKKAANSIARKKLTEEVNDDVENLDATDLSKKKLNEKVDDDIEDIDYTFLQEDYNELPPDDIIAYNELRSCADLFRMYKEKDLDINPDFQRDEVWADTQKTRFIDSLIKKLPIPSMCFSLDYKTEKWQVIDGLQRITSIIKFLETDNDWKLSRLDDIDERLRGKFVSEVKETDNGILFTRLANLTIPITVLRCDYSKSQHTNYLFTIFHRLNTGGIRLTNQEIRNAIYNGKFNSLIKRMNHRPEWRKILGLADNKSYRLSKEELILRFFSFYDNKDTYEGALSKFLNEYMARNRNPDNKWIELKTNLFNESVQLIYDKISDKKQLTKSSNVIIEALLYGIAKNINRLQNKTSLVLKRYFNNLIQDDNFSEVNIKEGLANKQKVLGRLNAAERIFSGQ